MVYEVTVARVEAPSDGGCSGDDHMAGVNPRNRGGQGVILYGVDAIAQALAELDPRYALVDRVMPQAGQVPVPRCPHARAADAARQAASGVA
jgi:hypothetical protein